MAGFDIQNQTLSETGDLNPVSRVRFPGIPSPFQDEFRAMLISQWRAADPEVSITTHS